MACKTCNEPKRSFAQSVTDKAKWVASFATIAAAIVCPICKGTGK